MNSWRKIATFIIMRLTHKKWKKRSFIWLINLILFVLCVCVCAHGVCMCVCMFVSETYFQLYCITTVNENGEMTQLYVFCCCFFPNQEYIRHRSLLLHWILTPLIAHSWAYAATAVHKHSQSPPRSHAQASKTHLYKWKTNQLLS